MSFGGQQRITLELDTDFRDGYEALKGAELEISIKKWKPRRSNDANKYFHVLVNKIAEALGKSDEDVKTDMVLRYGCFDRDEDNQIISCMLPESANAQDYYRYAKWYKNEWIGGRKYKCYLFYKQTHLMDSKEMSRLIEGTIFEAQELKIDTDTPEKQAWWDSLKGVTK